MYNNSEIAQKIKDITKKKGIPLKRLLDDCNLNINYISEFSKGKDITGNNLFIIAEYLDVSIDYLLGRTDQPNGFINNENGFKSINVNGSVGNNSINNNYAELDKHDRELLEEYNKLSLKNKAKVIRYMTELEDTAEE